MFKQLSIKNRIALFYSLAFSFVLLLLFISIYWVVNRGITKSMHEILNEEINSHTEYVSQQKPFKNYVEVNEWEEVEHTDISLNPVFIAIYDANFRLVENSPNLVQNKLEWNSRQNDSTPYYKNFKEIELLIRQAKLTNNGKIVGYVVIGVSTKHNELALEYLQIALLILFPISVILVFLIARIIAAKSIQPVFQVIETAQLISENNLSERIPLPENQDELFQLSTTINSLLDRLEFQIIRARQFSADASHELRTPLSIIKGTLEILIRRERTVNEYEEKIDYTLQQVDRLNHLVEQFLMIARIDNKSVTLNKIPLDINEEITSCISRFKTLIQEKNIDLNVVSIESKTIENYKEYIEIILDNILSNAIKYVNLKGKIEITSYIENTTYCIAFKDNGIGMNEEDVNRIKNRFFRAENPIISTTNGYGLGLNIASKLAELANAIIDIESENGKGTTVTLKFKI